RELAPSSAGQFAPAWSPDGNHLAYVTWSEQEGGHVHKVAVAGGKDTRLSRVSAFYNTPVWTPDGKEVVVAKGPWQQQSELSYFNFIPGEGLVLVRLPAEGGPDRRIAPLKGIHPHFADRPDRLYVYEGDSGLVSFRLDGTDRKVHVKVTGSATPLREKPEVADEIRMSPDGEHALAMLNNSIYQLIVPRIGAEPPSIVVTNPSGASFPVKKITTVGGQDMAWTAGGKEVSWSLGNTFFVYNLARAKAFEDSLRNAVAAKPAGVASPTAGKDSVTKVYEPRATVVELEVPRLKARGTIVLRGARLYTMAPGAANDGIIENGAVVVTDHRIVQVGPSAGIVTPAGARELDVTGKILMPGFVDAHAHMWPAWGVHRGVVWEYLANLAYGVTTTRDPQTSTTDVLTYADLVETGDLVGPRVFHTGPGVFNGENIKDRKDAQNVLKRYSQYYKTNTIKQYLAGDRNVRQWVVMATKEQKLTPTTEGALDLKLDLTQILDGYPGNEHSFPISPLYQDVVTLVAQSGTYYTPTLLVSYGGPWAENYYYTSTNVHDDAKLRRFVPHSEVDKLTRRRTWFHDDEHVFRLHAAQAKKIVEAGGRVCIGGHGQLQGLGYHWELWSVQSGGMKPMDALRCATVFGAESIGMRKDLGSLEKGKLADLIVLDRDPLLDIHHTNSVNMVMKNGLLYHANTLDQLWPTEKKLPAMYWWNRGPEAPALLK
ncbi:MAG: amidohydrolase family protein, partial [Ferruginibacter sp.]|nr:amidohydrolase family protein [Cytophagales bacterium]